MFTLRARIKKELICEFLVPAKDSGKVLIYCNGMPSVPKSLPTLDYWRKKGYWAIFPRYRGTWESDGLLFKNSPSKDILDVVDYISKGSITSLWDNKKFKISPKTFTLFGASFGSVPALEAALDPRISKTVLFCPLVDWTSPSREEPLRPLFKFIAKAFGNGYRFDKSKINSIILGKLYNPIKFAKKLKTKNILLIHAKDDPVVSMRSVRDFAKLSNAELVTVNKGGHLPISSIYKKRFEKLIFKFLKKKAR